MRALANSVLATLFVLVLLLVLPLIAVFGIPEFVPVVASSSADGMSLNHRPGPPGVGESARQRTDDIFRGFDEPAVADEFDTRVALGGEEEASSTPDPLAGWEFDDRGHATRPTQRPADPSRPRSRPTGTDARFVREDPFELDRADESGELTWQAAVGRLRALGIDEYHLSPGRGDEFHFSCAYSPRHNPRVVHRFEAEAGEPLAAVEKVLTQIDAWASRHR